MFTELQLSANLVNIQSFTAEGEDFRWYLKVGKLSCTATFPFPNRVHYLVKGWDLGAYNNKVVITF